MSVRFNKGDIVRDVNGRINTITNISVLYTLDDGSVCDESSLSIVKEYNTVNVILSQLCESLDVKEHEIVSGSRDRRLSLRRHMIMHTLKYKYKLSLHKIGKIMNRSHCTVFFGISHIEDMISIKDDETIELLKKLHQ